MLDKILNTTTSISKLRAIADHATSLANQLQEIDELTCPECGEQMKRTFKHADNEVKATKLSCKVCGFNETFNHDDKDRSIRVGKP